MAMLSASVFFFFFFFLLGSVAFPFRPPIAVGCWFFFPCEEIGGSVGKYDICIPLSVGAED